MSKLSIETHTRINGEVKQAQTRLNLLIELKWITVIKYKSHISLIESVKMVNRNSY